MTGLPPNGTIYRFIPRFIQTSIKQEDFKDKIKISPNPSNNVILINNIDSQNLTYTIVNVLGEVIKSGSLKETNSSFQDYQILLLFLHPKTLLNFQNHHHLFQLL